MAGALSSFAAERQRAEKFAGALRAMLREKGMIYLTALSDDDLIARVKELLDPPEPLEKPGYHLRTIERGVWGEPSKIREECEEFMDAVEQGVDLMALIELSDLIGAINGYLVKHHPTIHLDDLVQMNVVTQRAFVNGHRS